MGDHELDRVDREDTSWAGVPSVPKAEVLGTCCEHLVGGFPILSSHFVESEWLERFCILVESLNECKARNEARESLAHLVKMHCLRGNRNICPSRKGLTVREGEVLQDLPRWSVYCPHQEGMTKVRNGLTDRLTVHPRALLEEAIELVHLGHSGPCPSLLFDYLFGFFAKSRYVLRIRGQKENS